jgi:hypothetical protein
VLNREQHAREWGETEIRQVICDAARLGIPVEWLIWGPPPLPQGRLDPVGRPAAVAPLPPILSLEGGSFAIRGGPTPSRGRGAHAGDALM